MKITKARLRNIRSYADETVEFPDGTVLVHGDNGAGKTTLLMSIFGGLFLSKIRNVGPNDFNLDDIVRRGAEEGEIELTFEVEEVPYTVTWTIDTVGQNTATLDSPALDEPISGIRDVRSNVIDIVGMDEDSFSRSVYVQQGEVDRLFDDDARAELIDDLLGLDRIDRYRARMKGARRAANRLVKENKRAASNHRQTIDEEFEYDVDGYEAEIADTADEIAEVEADISEIEDYLDQLEEAKRDLESTIDRHDELQSELAEARDEREELLDDRGAQHRAIEEGEENIDAAREQIAALEDRIAKKRDALEELATPATTDAIEIDLSTEDAATETLDAAQDIVETAKVERADREGTLEQAEAEHERLIDEREERQDEREALETALSNLDDEIAAAEEAVDEAKGRLDKAIDERNTATRSFLPAERCPDSVTNETREAVEKRVDELTEQKNDLSQRHAGKEASLEAAKERVTDAHERVADAEDEIERLETRVDDTKSDLEEARETHTEVRDQFESDVNDLGDELDAFDISVSTGTLQDCIDERIPAAKSELQASLDETKNRIAKLEERKSTLESDREELEALDGVATCPKCGQDVDPEHVESELAEIDAEVEEIENELSEVIDRRETLDARREDLDSRRREAIELREFREDTVTEAERRVENLEDELADLEDDLEAARTTLDEAEEELQSAESEADELQATIDELNSEIEEISGEIEEGTDVLEGFETVQELRDEHDEFVDELNELESERETVASELDEIDATLEELTEDIDQQREAVAEAESELDIAEEAVTTAQTQRELVSDVVEAYDSIGDLETEIEGYEQEISHARDTIETLNAQLSSVEADIDDLESELGAIDIEEASEKLETVEAKSEQRESTLDDLEANLQSLNEERRLLEENLDSLQRFQERLQRAEDKREWAHDRATEFEELLSVYQGAKAELREQYLAYVNEYTNDIFSDIYKNRSYQQVRILEEGPDGTPYAIQLLRDDGTIEHPSNASGGERAIVNLALRAGIYKLIAEMREGDSGRLPPFILDEPTTFLDEGHVGRLEAMLDSIASWDVPQVIVVSHDERLIQGAEHECVVRIDDETNASTVDVHTGGRLVGDD